ncbi:MAG: PadR family transcriptional regulator [Anaerolineae bacterium]|nr:PadR family transcriptional regulator [Anaerolineae bacterium]
MLKYALLGFLNYRPLTGYDLKRIMDSSTTNFWHADLSQIYKTLKTLETEGAIVATIEPQSERPDKKIYTITEPGRSVLEKWLGTPLTETSPLKEVLLLKVFFSGGSNSKHVLTQLRLQRELHQLQLSKYEEQIPIEMATNIELMQAGANDVLLWEATRRAGILYEGMYLRWLDETIERIETQFQERTC